MTWVHFAFTLFALATLVIWAALIFEQPTDPPRRHREQRPRPPGIENRTY